MIGIANGVGIAIVIDRYRHRPRSSHRMSAVRQAERVMAFGDDRAAGMKGHAPFAVAVDDRAAGMKGHPPFSVAVDDRAAGMKGHPPRSVARAGGPARRKVRIS